MAMTKKERAEVDAALLKARMLGALRWTAEVKTDVLPPVAGGRNHYAQGWRCWASTSYGGDKVDWAWTESSTHGTGTHTSSMNRSASQGSISLHSTKLRALQALRHLVELECARRLAKIDQCIADEEADNDAPQT